LQFTLKENRKKEEKKMFTRTLVTAEVSVERIYKDKETGEIKKDCFDEKLPNCKTRDKAEILIEKQYKGDIVSILGIKFKLEKRVMTDEQFLLNSDVKDEKIVTEAELQEMKKED
jgi:hypothetical protein